MSQPRVVPIEKTIQQQLNEAIHLFEDNYGLEVRTLAIALLAILITISKLEI